MNIKKEIEELKNLQDQILLMKKLYTEENTIDTINYISGIIYNNIEELTPKNEDLSDNQSKPSTNIINKSPYTFPKIQTFDFLLNHEKKELDMFLSRFKNGNYVFNLRKVIKNSDKEHIVFKKLVEVGILAKSYTLVCPHCGLGNISDNLTEEEYKSFKQTLLSGSPDSKEDLEEKYISNCDHCDEYFSLSDKHDFNFNERHIMVR